MTSKVSSDGAAFVDQGYFWQPLEEAPQGVKVQLLSRYGVAAYGVVTGTTIEDGFWVAWAPLPKRKEKA